MTSDGAGDFSSVVKNLQDVNKVYLNRLREFISSNEIQDYCKKKSEILKVYHLDETEQFSFFESISDKYYYEKFHSDILRTILSPDTPKIGNKVFLKAFLSCIDVGEDTFDVERNTEVVTEQYTQGIESKGYIDIIIRNSKGKAIIIENKINYAENQPNQLARYVRYVTEHNFELVKLVYLIPPCIGKYDEEYKKICKVIKNYDKSYEVEKNRLMEAGLLVVRAAVTDPKKEPKSLVSFMDECIRLLPLDENPTARIYLEQYKILLQHIGGNIYMDAPNKEFIKEIYSDTKKLEDAVSFWQVWENRAIIFFDLVMHSVIEKMNKRKFTRFEPWKGIAGVSKKINNFEVCAYIQDKKYIGVGFYSQKDMSNSCQVKLKKVLDECTKTLSSCFPIESSTEKNWVYKQIGIEDIDKEIVTLDDFTDNLIENLKKLDKEYSKISKN